MSESIEVMVSIKAIKNTEIQLRYTIKSDTSIHYSSNVLYASQFYKEYFFQVENPREVEQLNLWLGDTANTIFIDHVVFVHCKSNTKDTLYNWMPHSHQAGELFLDYSNILLAAQSPRYIELRVTGLFPSIRMDVGKIFEKMPKVDQVLVEMKLLFSAALFAFFIFLTMWKGPAKLSKMRYDLEVSRHQILVYSFLLFLLISFLNSQFGWIKDMPNSENRALSEKPKLQAKSLYILPDLYNHYIEEHYSLRNFFFFINSVLHTKILQESAVPDKVILGKKGWFFYNETTTVNDFRRLSIIDSNEVKNVLSILISRLRWLKSRNIKYYILVPPNKERIYPHFMPDAFFKVDRYGHNRLDYYKNLVSNYTDAVIIDPTEALQQGANKKDVFYSTDTHWNLYGGFIGYHCLMNAIRKDFPQLIIPKEDDFIVLEDFRSEGDLSSMLALQDVYRRKEYSFVFKDTSKHLVIARPMEIISSFNNQTIDSSQLKLVMFRDSYANYLIPFLNLHFKRAVYIWNYEFMPEVIESEHPDVVIFESLERFISYAFTIPNPPVVDEELKTKQ